MNKPTLLTVSLLACLMCQSAFAQESVTPKFAQEKKLGIPKRSLEAAKATGWLLLTLLFTRGVSGHIAEVYCNNRMVHLVQQLNPDNEQRTYVGDTTDSIFLSIIYTYLLYHTSKWGHEALSKAYHGKENN